MKKKPIAHDKLVKIIDVDPKSKAMDLTFRRKPQQASNEENQMARERTNKYPPKTLVNLQRAEVFLATYVDGQQYSDSRLVVKIGNQLSYLHPEIARDGRGVDATLKPPAGWLKEQIFEHIGNLPEADNSIPEDEVVDLPEGAVG